jgi:hypothetical protein
MQTRSQGGFQTEVEFTLPRGYVDSDGNLHRHGVMRLATAADEILPLRDPRVQQNQAYHAVIVLARVITRLGEVPTIDTRVIENLFASDLDYLQRLYERINDGDGAEEAPTPAGLRPEARAEAGRGMRAVGEA